MSIILHTERADSKAVKIPKRYNGTVKKPELISIENAILSGVNPIHSFLTMRADYSEGIEKCQLTNTYSYHEEKSSNKTSLIDDENSYFETDDGLFTIRKGEKINIINAKIEVLQMCEVQWNNHENIRWVLCRLYRENDNYTYKICVKECDYKDLPKKIRRECLDIHINSKYTNVLEKYLTDKFCKVKDTIANENININRGWCEKNDVVKFEDSAHNLKYLKSIGINCGEGNTAPIVNINDDFDERWKYFIVWRRFIEIGKKGKEITAIYLFGFLGIAKYWLEKAMVPCHFVLYVCGVTNSLKTSVVQCITNVFEQDMSKKNLRFTGTRASILDYISTHQDDTILVDDFSNTESASKKTSKEAIETILRVVGDDMIPTKMNSSGEISFRKIRCAIAMTGETEADLAKSSQLRMMKINVDRNTFDCIALRYIQENPLIIQEHLAAFIRFLESKGNDMVSKMKERIPNVRERLRYKYEPRFIDIIAVFEMLIMLWYEFGKWSGEDFATLADKAEIFEKHILELMTQNENYCKFLNPGVQYIYALDKIITSDTKTKIADSEEVFNQDEIAYIGFYENEGNELLWLKYDSMHKLVRSFWQGLGRDFLATPKQVKESLCQSGLIKTVKNSRGGIDYTMKAKKGRRQRMVVLYVDKCKRVLEESVLL